MVKLLEEPLMDEPKTVAETGAPTEARFVQAIEVLDRWETSRLMTVLLSLDGTPRRGGLAPSLQRVDVRFEPDAKRLTTASHLADARMTGEVIQGQASREATEPKDNSST